MMRIDALIAEFPDLDAAEIEGWIERHWVTPDFDDSEDWIFADIDVARVRLIRDLRRDLGVDEGTVPLMLSLLDQVYDLRCALMAINRAIAIQPPEIREPVRDAIHAALDAHRLMAQFGERND